MAELKTKLGYSIYTSDKSGLIKEMVAIAKPLTKQHIEEAAAQYDRADGKINSFEDSTDYDVIIGAKRYPPKAIIGIALGNYYGLQILSKHFKGGAKSSCFRILIDLDFSIETKSVKEVDPKREDEVFDLSKFKVGQSFSKLQSFHHGGVRVPRQGRDISGVIRFNNCVILFVTLDKGAKDSEYKYEDRFVLGGKLFQWDSQNTNTPETPHMQMIIKGSPVALFARINEKNRGKTLPFTFVGRLSYLKHSYPFDSKEKPVEVIFEVLDYQSSAPKDLLSLYEWEQNSTSIGLHASDSLDMNLVETNAPSLNHKAQPYKRKSAASGTTNWAEKDEKNRNLGLFGEKIVMQNEIERLTELGRSDLAELVSHVALENDYAGYDILSYDSDGTKKFIEVKTTKQSKSTSFFISQNEVQTSIEKAEQYWIYRVYGLNENNKTARFYALQGSVEKNFNLNPYSFKASPK
ncbi:DUF3427 domain-containing protein [Alteromonas mediterranea]|uniref:DUF3427 domain-containing protein n=1 Tax=Alteromonas mediterranea TaxID=314275 RepID=UPI0012F97B34|nr:DUF3427 domain-containing protein [Alteromonas mediterranea]QGX61697.1 DUF3427 domain-containing protein [Alteromonas mediterranea]